MTLSAIFLPNVLRCKPTSFVSVYFFFVYALNLLVQCSFLCLLLSSKKVLCDIQSRLTGNQYWLASCITALPHPTYQRCSLQRPFRRLKVSGRIHLEACFTLRCFQRLSVPNVATGQCHWHDNPNTRDSSTPVLSYQEQLLSILQRPRQIGTELSHDVLNPARVPL